MGSGSFTSPRYSCGRRRIIANQPIIQLHSSLTRAMSKASIKLQEVVFAWKGGNHHRVRMQKHTRRIGCQFHHALGRKCRPCRRTHLVNMELSTPARRKKPADTTDNRRVLIRVEYGGIHRPRAL